MPLKIAFLRPQNGSRLKPCYAKALLPLPRAYPGGRPGPKTLPPSRGAQENKVFFCADVPDPTARMSMTLRDGETTIKIKFALLRGVGLGDREENRPKTLYFVGNATTIKF